MSTSRYGHSITRDTQGILESLRHREEALDRWERDLRSREDSLTREMNHYHKMNKTPNNRPMKRTRVKKEKDYSKLAAPRETYAEESETTDVIKNETSY